MTVIFAYGSNLALTRTGLKPLEQAWLPDHSLRFRRRRYDGRGALDAAPAVGCICGGWLFEATEEAVAFLDEKEGVLAGAYIRTTMTLLNADGDTLKAEVYTVCAPVDFVQPDATYISHVRAGLAQFGLDNTAFEEALNNRPLHALPLFVYGTLKKGGTNASIIPADTITSRRSAWVKGALWHGVTYPVLIKGDVQVEGELIVLSVSDAAAVLKEVDKLEGFQGFDEKDLLFRRTIVRTEHDGDWAWVYRPVFSIE